VFCSGAPCFLGPFGLPFGGQPRTMSLVASAPLTGATIGARGPLQRLLSERCDEGRLLNRGGVACRGAGRRRVDTWDNPAVLYSRPPGRWTASGPTALCENPVLVGNRPVPAVLPAS